MASSTDQPNLRYATSYLRQDVCSLFWLLSPGTTSTIEGKQLASLHEEIESCASALGAEYAEACGTCGLLIPNHKVDRGTVATDEDVMVRLGQLICRWGVAQEPVVKLHVGLHRGILSSLRLWGSNQGSRGYFGEGIQIAKSLAENSQENCTHISRQVRDGLKLLDRVPLACVRGEGSYMLKPWSQVFEDCEEEMTKTISTPAVRRRRPSVSAHWFNATFTFFDEDGCVEIPRRVDETRPVMTADEFRTVLVDAGVDVWKYGKGKAKTIKDFYRSVILERKSRLVSAVGSTGQPRLELHTELVRVNFTCESKNGQLYNLILASEISQDGRIIFRNQPLAHKIRSDSKWQESVAQCFSERFGLSPEMQQQALEMDESKYAYEEFSKESASTPGIITYYMTHEVCVRVRSQSVAALKALGLPDMQPFTTLESAQGSESKLQWRWAPGGEVQQMSEQDALSYLLVKYGVRLDSFSKRSFEELCDEVFEAKYSTLSVTEEGEIQRHINVIKVWFYADILSLEHVLTCRWKVANGKNIAISKCQPISCRMLRDQDWRASMQMALVDRLGLDLEFQEKFVTFDELSYRLSEEVEYSRSHPGLKTVYYIHEVQCRVANPTEAGMQVLGLPGGNDFTTRRIKDSSSNSVTYCWCWRPYSEVFPELNVINSTSQPKRGLTDGATPAGPKAEVKRRVQAVTPSNLVSVDLNKLSMNPGCAVLREMMKGKRMNLDRALNAAKRIRDPNYTCRHYFEDCVAAFPELTLYLVTNTANSEDTTSSGRTGDDEFQRTIGALFAVYWLMRLDLDGAKSFAFGVDDEWKPLNVNSTSVERSEEEKKKRDDFCKTFPWEKVVGLLQDSGLCRQTVGSMDGCSHDVDRTLAMLVLTAVHDICKVQLLCPIVEEKHAPFHNIKAGERILDHDVALSYAMEACPESLPSFFVLPAAQQRSVLFTQSKMEYNMGWLVQAEAPPGALFQKLKAIIDSGGATKEDVAFYFVHWLTDLAGAEPYPKEGCEKFVLKFPTKVLQAFLNSFSIVHHLSGQTETQVFEHYLQWRWSTSEEPLFGPAPRGYSSIAQMRMVVMAQGDSNKVLTAFRSMLVHEPAEADVLAEELSRTGCQGQSFSTDRPRREGGPAILVYYAPALLHKAHASDAKGALMVLAEVFAAARHLFPLTLEDANVTVQANIAAIKDLEPSALREPLTNPVQVWALQKVNSTDATVVSINLTDEQNSCDGSKRYVLFANSRKRKNCMSDSGGKGCENDQ